MSRAPSYSTKNITRPAPPKFISDLDSHKQHNRKLGGGGKVQSKAKRPKSRYGHKRSQSQAQHSPLSQKFSRASKKGSRKGGKGKKRKPKSPLHSKFGENVNMNMNKIHENLNLKFTEKIDFCDPNQNFDGETYSSFKNHPSKENFDPETGELRFGGYMSYNANNRPNFESEGQSVSQSRPQTGGGVSRGPHGRRFPPAAPFTERNVPQPTMEDGYHSHPIHPENTPEQYEAVNINQALQERMNQRRYSGNYSRTSHMTSTTKNGAQNHFQSHQQQIGGHQHHQAPPNPHNSHQKYQDEFTNPQKYIEQQSNQTYQMALKKLKNIRTKSLCGDAESVKINQIVKSNIMGGNAQNNPNKGKSGQSHQSQANGVGGLGNTSHSFYSIKGGSNSIQANPGKAGKASNSSNQLAARNPSSATAAILNAPQIVRKDKMPDQAYLKKYFRSNGALRRGFYSETGVVHNDASRPFKGRSLVASALNNAKPGRRHQKQLIKTTNYPSQKVGAQARPYTINNSKIESKKSIPASQISEQPLNVIERNLGVVNNDFTTAAYRANTSTHVGPSGRPSSAFVAKVKEIKSRVTHEQFSWNRGPNASSGILSNNKLDSTSKQSLVAAGRLKGSSISTAHEIIPHQAGSTTINHRHRRNMSIGQSNRVLKTIVRRTPFKTDRDSRSRGTPNNGANRDLRAGSTRSINSFGSSGAKSRSMTPVSREHGIRTRRRHFDSRSISKSPLPRKVTMTTAEKVIIKGDVTSRSPSRLGSQTPNSRLNRLDVGSEGSESGEDELREADLLPKKILNRKPTFGKTLPLKSFKIDLSSGDKNRPINSSGSHGSLGQAFPNIRKQKSSLVNRSIIDEPHPQDALSVQDNEASQVALNASETKMTSNQHDDSMYALRNRGSRLPTETDAPHAMNYQTAITASSVTQKLYTGQNSSQQGQLNKKMNFTDSKNILYAENDQSRKEGRQSKRSRGSKHSQLQTTPFNEQNGSGAKNERNHDSADRRKGQNTWENHRRQRSISRKWDRESANGGHSNQHLSVSGLNDSKISGSSHTKKSKSKPMNSARDESSHKDTHPNNENSRKMDYLGVVSVGNEPPRTHPREDNTSDSATQICKNLIRESTRSPRNFDNGEDELDLGRGVGLIGSQNINIQDGSQDRELHQVSVNQFGSPNPPKNQTSAQNYENHLQAAGMDSNRNQGFDGREINDMGSPEEHGMVNPMNIVSGQKSEAQKSPDAMSPNFKRKAGGGATSLAIPGYRGHTNHQSESDIRKNSNGKFSGNGKRSDACILNEFSLQGSSCEYVESSFNNLKKQLENEKYKNRVLEEQIHALKQNNAQQGSNQGCSGSKDPKSSPKNRLESGSMVLTKNSSFGFQQQENSDNNNSGFKLAPHTRQEGNIFKPGTEASEDPSLPNSEKNTSERLREEQTKQYEDLYHKYEQVFEDNQKLIQQVEEFQEYITKVEESNQGHLEALQKAHSEQTHKLKEDYESVVRRLEGKVNKLIDNYEIQKSKKIKERKKRKKQRSEFDAEMASKVNLVNQLKSEVATLKYTINLLTEAAEKSDRQESTRKGSRGMSFQQTIGFSEELESANMKIENLEKKNKKLKSEMKGLKKRVREEEELELSKAAFDELKNRVILLVQENNRLNAVIDADTRGSVLHPLQSVDVDMPEE